MRRPARLAVPAVYVVAVAAYACLALLAGCAGTPSAKKAPDEIPATLPALNTPTSASVQPGLSIARWWTHFDDPALDALVEQALRRNHDLAIAAARVREARAQLDEVRGAARPSLDLQIANGRARQPAHLLPPGAPRTTGSHSVSLAAGYELDLWGRLAAGTDAARQRLLGQAWARAAIEWGLTAQLAEAHFSLRAVERQIEVAEAMRASRATTLSLRRREQQAGSASEFDLRRAEAELADTDATLVTLRRQQLALDGTIALLAGRAPGEMASAVARRAPLDPAQPFVARLPHGDAAVMLANRPDLRQAEAQLDASRADVAAARTATLPAVRLTGNVGSDVRTLASLFEGPGFVWSLALSATQSIVDGGQRRARVEQADARVEQAHAAYRQAVLAAVVELREAYVALDLTQAAQRAGQERVAALVRARTLARTGVGAGALAQLDLLDAERNVLSAQLAEATAHRDRLIAQVAAFKALGGGHAGAPLQP